MSCLGCDQEANRIEAGFQRKKEEAKKYVQEHQKAVAVYYEGGEWKFILADIAIRENIPFREMVSIGQ